MSGLRSRNKGKRGERAAAKALGEVLGIDMRRGQQFSGLGGDDITGWAGVHVEVKRVERFNLYDAIHQSAEDAGEDVPIVIHRKNGEPWVVCLYLDDLVELSDRVQDAMRDD